MLELNSIQPAHECAGVSVGADLRFRAEARAQRSGVPVDRNRPVPGEMLQMEELPEAVDVGPHQDGAARPIADRSRFDRSVGSRALDPGGRNLTRRARRPRSEGCPERRPAGGDRPIGGHPRHRDGGPSRIDVVGDHPVNECAAGLVRDDLPVNRRARELEAFRGPAGLEIARRGDARDVVIPSPGLVPFPGDERTACSVRRDDGMVFAAVAGRDGRAVGLPGR